MAEIQAPNHPTAAEILKQVRAALLEEFRNAVDANPTRAEIMIERYTCLPEDDPGGWAPNAAVVIHSECIPLPMPLDVPSIEAWQRISERLDGHFCEHINNSVVAVYRS